MAKGAVEGDIGDWEGVDMSVIKQRFTWALEATKSSGDATLTTLKKILPKVCIDKLDKGLFASETSKTAKKLPWNRFKTKDFFVKMTGSEDAAKKTCIQIMSDEEQRLASKGAQNAAVVNRLTDTSKYTGSHGARFDKDGKGKGASGRKDECDNTGYVGNYKGEGTYKGN